MFDLTGKKALVTGAGSGIGQAIALRFAQQGAEVVVVDLDESNAAATVAAIMAAGGQGEVGVCNVANQQAVDALFGGLGGLDILVNNAGVAHIGTVETTSEADIDRVISVNVKGVYNCLRAAVPLLRQNGGGAILNMASVVASVGIPDRFAYTMSKGAVWGMTLSVAKDYLKDKIRCNSISPARVHTPFVDGYLATKSLKFNDNYHIIGLGLSYGDSFLVTQPQIIDLFKLI